MPTVRCLWMCCVLLGLYSLSFVAGQPERLLPPWVKSEKFPEKLPIVGKTLALANIIEACRVGWPSLDCDLFCVPKADTELVQKGQSKVRDFPCTREIKAKFYTELTEGRKLYLNEDETSFKELFDYYLAHTFEGSEPTGEEYDPKFPFVSEDLLDPALAMAMLLPDFFRGFLARRTPQRWMKLTLLDDTNLMLAITEATESIIAFAGYESPSVGNSPRSEPLDSGQHPKRSSDPSPSQEPPVPVVLKVSVSLGEKTIQRGQSKQVIEKLKEGWISNKKMDLLARAGAISGVVAEEEGFLNYEKLWNELDKRPDGLPKPLKLFPDWTTNASIKRRVLVLERALQIGPKMRDSWEFLQLHAWLCSTLVSVGFHHCDLHDGNILLKAGKPTDAKSRTTSARLIDLSKAVRNSDPLTLLPCSTRVMPLEWRLEIVGNTIWCHWAQAIRWEDQWFLAQNMLRSAKGLDDDFQNELRTLAQDETQSCFAAVGGHCAFESLGHLVQHCMTDLEQKMQQENVRNTCTAQGQLKFANEVIRLIKGRNSEKQNVSGDSRDAARPTSQHQSSSTTSSEPSSNSGSSRIAQETAPHTIPEQDVAGQDPAANGPESKRESISTQRKTSSSLSRSQQSPQHSEHHSRDDTPKKHRGRSRSLEPTSSRDRGTSSSAHESRGRVKERRHSWDSFEARSVPKDQII